MSGIAMKTILEVVKAGAGFLERAGVDEARLNMEHLLAHVLGCRRLDLYLRFGEVLPERDLAALRELTKRRGEGVPLQHLLGSVEFMGHELVCDGRALVPRPETEFLVDWLIAEVGRGTLPRPIRLLDLATGSGCIGLSLAAAFADAEVWLIDLSEEALDLARLNASRLGLDRVQALRSDLFEKASGRFDWVVSNLPYIPSAEVRELAREVQRDPQLALDGGPDGLQLLRRFLVEALPFLQGSALVALEVGHDQAKVVLDLALQSGWSEGRILQDLAGVERFVILRGPLQAAPKVSDDEHEEPTAVGS